MITRTQAIELFGSAFNLAKELGYASRHVVYMWPKDDPIPELPFLKIRYELKPEAFNPDGSLRPRQEEASRNAV